MTKARTLADNFAADINGITAGTGITGGGTSGTVTITNDMATAINAKGDLIIGTGADAYSRLAVASTAGYLLTVDSAETTGLKWAAPAGGGKVLQVVHSSTTTEVSSSTATFVDTNLTATITPTSASSTILILLTQGGCFKSTGSLNNGLDLRLLRGATSLEQFGYRFLDTQTTLQFYGEYSYNYQDSPATTSSTTYKTQFRNQGTLSTVTVQKDGIPSRITLLEIGA